MNRIVLASIGIAMLAGGAEFASAAWSDQAPSNQTLAKPSADVSANAQNGTTGPTFQERNPRYKLHPSDVFDLTFPFSPEFNQLAVTVQPDGYITVGSIGELYVSGKTIPELKQMLRTAYANILHDPVVDVTVKDFQKPFFTAAGQVLNPGRYDLRTDTTVTEAIAIAGGFTTSSKHSEVFLFRHVSNNWLEVKKIDVKKMYAAGNLTEDLHLQPGDMVYVPQNRISKIQKYIPTPGVGMSAIAP